MPAPHSPSPPSAPTGQAQPQPPWTLAVTGHRPNRLNPLRIDQLGPELQALFSQLAAIDGPRPSLLSALAEGADRAAAHAALACAWPLTVLLPCPAARYRSQFSSTASHAEFDALLARATHLYCLRSAPETPFETLYAKLGEALVERAHMLLAIWDGAAARGPGGTAEVVHAALARPIPVLRVGSEMGGAAQVLHAAANGAITTQVCDARALSAALHAAQTCAALRAPQHLHTIHTAGDDSRPGSSDNPPLSAPPPTASP